MEKMRNKGHINNIVRVIKNIPTSIKMASIGVPAIIMLIVITLILVGEIQNTNNETS